MIELCENTSQFAGDGVGSCSQNCLQWTRPRTNGGRQPGLINHIFFYIMWTAWLLIWRIEDTRIYYGKKASLWRQYDVLLVNLRSWHSCGWFFDMHHLPNHCWRLNTALCGNVISYWQWSLLVGLGWSHKWCNSTVRIWSPCVNQPECSLPHC